MAKARKRRIKTNSLCQSLFKRRSKEIFHRKLDVLTVVWGSERFRFHLYGKQAQLFADHQALESS